MTGVVSVDPRTGRPVQVVAQETTRGEVDALCASALTATSGIEAMGRAGRMTVLRGMADGLEERREEIVRLADRETALGSTRLEGEMVRTCHQLRLFAEVLEEGSYLEAAIDHPSATPMGPRPDLRRMLVPIGPVAVFGASNFPLAFSVPGGETAAAIAAGCAVVVKAHHSHPATSQLCFEILHEAATAARAPEGTLSLILGLDAGAALVEHPAIRAVGFTGSSASARALLRIIERRPDPIAFFGELSSLNSVVVTPLAAEERTSELAEGLVSSFTQGAGQFCTKPGLLLVPSGPSGDALVREMSDRVRNMSAPCLLNKPIAASYERRTGRLIATAGVEVLAQGHEADGGGFHVVPLLLTTSASTMPEEVTEECFGPVAVVARYSDEGDLLGGLQKMPASLAATVLRGETETELPARVSAAFRSRAGRLVYDGYPTGVAVSWAQHHGGPWPSTNSQHTSVGTTAIRRFLRPMAWQEAPADLLPPELTDECTEIPRRVDGALRLANPTAAL